MGDDGNGIDNISAGREGGCVLHICLYLTDLFEDTMAMKATSGWTSIPGECKKGAKTETSQKQETRNTEHNERSQPTRSTHPGKDT